MIKIDLSVREALNMISNGCSLEMHEKICTALEVALGTNQRRRLTVTGGMSTDNRIPCIKAIRLATGWGLKETKDWTDVLCGRYDEGLGRWVSGDRTHSMVLPTPHAAEQLLDNLTALGCVGHIS